MQNTGHSQKDVEKHLKISQSQISRILNGKFKREGKAVRILLKYAEIYALKGSAKAKQQLRKQLTEGISDVWDGSEEDAYQLLRLLEFVKDFRSRR